MASNFVLFGFVVVVVVVVCFVLLLLLFLLLLDFKRLMKETIKSYGISIANLNLACLKSIFCKRNHLVFNVKSVQILKMKKL